ncbi:hypothetical protein AB0N07_39220 [Streptomyces sp. NPDC051172]|uniref:hypothetical protein n=1 Tax=Streptomyces sp. NPDC051172 TaxID=3155796 RepID=UPI003427C9E4
MAERTTSIPSDAPRDRRRVGRAAVMALAVTASAPAAPAGADGPRASQWAPTAFKAQQAGKTCRGTGVTVTSRPPSPGRDPRHGLGTVDPAAALAYRPAPSATATASDSTVHTAVPATDPTANGRDSVAARSEDPAALLTLLAVGAGLIVPTAIAWLLIRRSTFPFVLFNPFDLFDDG